jgi:L-fuconate dehydratase
VSKIAEVGVHDVRFPTSRTLAGSDAMNVAPDYSMAYVVIRTDADDGLEGHGFTFTIGRGTEVCVAAAHAYGELVVGMETDDIFSDLGAFWRRLVGDSPLRWIGPEKGAVHLGFAAVINAVWDLYAKRLGKPLWQVLADMAPAELVGLVDFRYLDDVLSPGRAEDLLAERFSGRSERRARLAARGIEAYTTSVGWLGYDDDEVAERCRAAVKAGWGKMKMKVGGSLEADVRRAAVVRQEIGPDRELMMDANQVWGVDQALVAMSRLREFEPLWIEEPTSPDDVLGHATIARAVAPVLVATGEHVHNRIMYKQFLQTGGMGVCQLDACRLGGVNEAVAVMLLAASFGVPVCPHAGGVGLCEYVQHLAAFDQIAVSPVADRAVVEYVDHLHEHFVDPVEVRDGHYVLPSRPGFSAELRPESLERFSYPHGEEWKAQD